MGFCEGVLPSGYSQSKTPTSGMGMVKRDFILAKTETSIDRRGAGTEVMLAIGDLSADPTVAAMDAG